MKSNLLIVAIAISVTGFVGCGGGKTPDTEKLTVQQATLSPAVVQILYFHGERRCEACTGIAELSANLYKSKYLGNSAVHYADINIELDQNRALASKYKVTGSSLIIDVKGKANDISWEAFRFVLPKPDSLKSIIEGIVEKGLKE